MKKRILNIGCGKEYYGTDFVGLHPSRSGIIKCDIDKEELPYKKETFDKVYAKCVLEHLTNLGFALKEMSRVLKRNGILEIITDNASYLGFHLSIFGANLHMGGYVGYGKEDKHYALYTAEHLKNFCKKLGLKIVKVEYLNTEAKWYVQIIRALLRMLSPRLAYPRIKIVAYKK